MNILIEISELFIKKKAGIPTVISEIVKRITNYNKTIKCCFSGFSFSQSNLENFEKSFPQQVEFKIRKFPNKLINYCIKYFLPIEVLTNSKFDVAFFPGSSLFFSKRKSVAIIHDIALRVNPKWNKFHYTKNILLQWKYILPKLTFIITPSFSTKNDLIKFYNIPEKKIKVIPLGVDHNLFCSINPSEINPEVKKYKNFILYVGTLEPRKNIVAIIKSFEKIKSRGWEGNLLLIGKKGWLFKEIIEVYNQSKYKDNIYFLDYVEKDVLPHFYNSAKLFIYPSLYEGFGLPVLEAMACGCPVITSKVSSLPEVVGDTAILVDPYNEDEITNAIERILSDENLRRKMSKKGAERAELFSWDKCVQEILQVLKNIASA